MDILYYCEEEKKLKNDDRLSSKSRSFESLPQKQISFSLWYIEGKLKLLAFFFSFPFTSKLISQKADEQSLQSKQREKARPEKILSF